MKRSNMIIEAPAIYKMQGSQFNGSIAIPLEIILPD